MVAFTEAQTAFAAVGGRATSDLQLVLGSIDLADEPATRAVLFEAYPDLVATYGPMAGAFGADFYDEARAEAAVRGFYSAHVADIPAPERMESNILHGLKPLLLEVPDVGLTLSLLSASMNRNVQQVARDTVSLSAENDPVRARWARVPHGHDTCAFCMVQAGRGAVFGQRSASKHYHTGCGCTAVPIWGEKDLSRLKRAAGYDPDDFERKYLDARAEAGRMSLKGASSDPDEQSILQIMRAKYGLR